MRHKILLAAVCSGLTLAASATERIFTYTYEPETLPKGAFEFEQSITLREGRNAAVGKLDFHRLQFREEFEYGLTDNYQLALYLNHQYEFFKDAATGKKSSRYEWAGISLENKFLVLNPAEHAIGLALYLEPTISDGAAEVEEKLILGQRHGDWKWALNLTHATEWSDGFREREGELELSLGVARQLGRRWTLGIEARDHNEIPEYKEWENTALYIGPVVSYKRERWWATLSVMPQVYGVNFQGNPDGDSSLELEGHERLNVRLLVGFSF